MKILNLAARLFVVALCCSSVAAFGADNGQKPAAQGHGEIIAQKIKDEVGLQLKQAGASYEGLKATVAVRGGPATPVKVAYTGLRNFKGTDGSSPAESGEFVLNYVGGGTWQGELAGTQFSVPVAATDDIARPFVDDPEVLGEWESVDFVADPEDFEPQKPAWKGDLYLKNLTFLADGKTAKPWLTWTKGMVMHRGDKTASKYIVREFAGQKYLFFEWKSGDVTIAGRKPHWYVLKKRKA
jgi:hypothetical protein